MKRNPFLALVGAAALAAGSGLAQTNWTEWRVEQRFRVPAPGLVKLRLPAETLGEARAGLGDLRLVGVKNGEVPYALERTGAPERRRVRPRSFQVVLQEGQTVLRVETGESELLDGVELSTPADHFIKAVHVEVSGDGKAWERVVQGAPLYRRGAGQGQLEVPVPDLQARWLRLIIDDKRTGPVPFTGAELVLAAQEPPCELADARIVQREESPGQTRLMASLPAAHLRVAGLEIQTPDPLFAREVRVSTREVVEGTLQETLAASGAIHRLSLDDGRAHSNLWIRVEKPLDTREVALTIVNEDSPPLKVAGVRVRWRPVNLIFHAPEAGEYRLLSGHALCGAPRYDLGGLSADLGRARLQDLKVTPPAANPDHRAPAALPGVEDRAAILDAAGWKYRRAVGLKGPGVHELEMDTAVMAHAQRGLWDLRLLRGSNQVPYVVEQGLVLRTLVPESTVAPDPRRPQVSRWQLRLPFAGLPVTCLACTSPTRVFERNVTLYEEARTDRGDRYQRMLGTGVWRQTPGSEGAGLAIDLSGAPETDTFWLETDNGDNPPVVLEKFALFHPGARILFKSDTAEALALYYGNREARAPRYDLNLVSGQLLASERLGAALGPEERLTKGSWREQFGEGGKGGPLIWVMLGVVLVVLGGLIIRLLPSGESKGPTAS